ncbi:hypothetical protein PIB30_054225 [Stylosanthes scabra]|uniref:Uncharacterized protein n=1 Tax=Stylosanthes scabra TaxID=79078 RepID=A0ABU6VIA9_9FABA|nr:hypothetical protein [Stylosanthes scabra]
MVGNVDSAENRDVTLPYYAIIRDLQVMRPFDDKSGNGWKTESCSIRVYNGRTMRMKSKESKDKIRTTKARHSQSYDVSTLDRP